MVSHSEDGIGSSGVKKQNFVWEKSLEKNWELLNIDKDGKLIAESEKEYQAILDRLNKTTPNVKLGLARYIFIAIDTSESSRMTHDLKPNNLLCTVNLLKSFIKKLLQKNPIVQVVFAVSFGRKAILLDSSGQSSSLLGTLSGQLQSVTNRFSTKKGDTDTSGGNFSDLPSTQHVLQLAESFFRRVPNYATKEILYIVSAVNSADPGNIFASNTRMFTALSVKLNVIHLGCEVFCLRELAEKSNGGEFFVPLDEKHFEKILDSISLPVPLTDPSCFKMIHLAFAKSIDDNIRFRICKLHVDNKCLCDRCYECPKCFANYCSIPIDCRICGLTLTSSIYIARSYQHLFPLQKLQQHEFEEQDAASPNIEQFCFMCQQQFDLNTAQHYFTKDGAFSGGPDVRKYCLDCNLFMVNSIGASF